MGIFSKDKDGDRLRRDRDTVFDGIGRAARKMGRGVTGESTDGHFDRKSGEFIENKRSVASGERPQGRDLRSDEHYPVARMTTEDDRRAYREERDNFREQRDGGRRAGSYADHADRAQHEVPRAHHAGRYGGHDHHDHGFHRGHQHGQGGGFLETIASVAFRMCSQGGGMLGNPFNVRAGGGFMRLAGGFLEDQIPDVRYGYTRPDNWDTFRKGIDGKHGFEGHGMNHHGHGGPVNLDGRNLQQLAGIALGALKNV